MKTSSTFHNVKSENEILDDAYYIDYDKDWKLGVLLCIKYSLHVY